MHGFWALLNFCQSIKNELRNPLGHFSAFLRKEFAGIPLNSFIDLAPETNHTLIQSHLLLLEIPDFFSWNFILTSKYSILVQLPTHLATLKKYETTTSLWSSLVDCVDSSWFLGRNSQLQGSRKCLEMFETPKLSSNFHSFIEVETPKFLAVGEAYDNLPRQYKSTMSPWKHLPRLLAEFRHASNQTL